MFLFKGLVRMHITDYHNKIQFLCTACKVVFTAKQSLHTHLKTKWKTKFFKPLTKCNQCDFETLDENKLNKHSKNKHKKQVVHCSLNFTNKPNLINHMASFHKIGWIKLNYNANANNGLVPSWGPGPLQINFLKSCSKKRF